MAMGILVLSVGELITKVMGYKEGIVGNISHIFKHTVYLRTVHDDLVCVTSHKTKGPMNLNVKGIDFGGVKPHDPVYKDDLTLRIGDLSISTKDAPIYRSNRDFTRTDGLCYRVLSMANVLSSLDLKGSIIDSESFFFDAFSQRIRKVTLSSAKMDAGGLQSAIRGLVGLGSGATPSGDDFVAGFLFFLQATGGKEILADLKFAIDNETSWHSRKFIEYAQDGLVVEPVENLAVGLLSGFESELSDYIQALLALGHSSGIDAAVGVVFATTYGKEKEYCEDLLSKFRFRP